MYGLCDDDGFDEWMALTLHIHVFCMYTLKITHLKTKQEGKYRSSRLGNSCNVLLETVGLLRTRWIE